MSANFFQVIGLTPKIGRTFTDDEDRAGAPQVVVISDRLWQRKFARNPAILGQTLMLQNRPTTVIGVMPPEMNAPGDVDAWFSVMRRADNPAWPNRLIHPNLYAWARLKNNVSLDQARTEMRGIAARIEQANPDTNKDVTALLTPVLESMVGKYRTNLALLLGAVALVLLIACANLANLFAVRGAGRAREFAIRAAVGASRQQLVRQLLIESLVVASLGGTLGFLAAMWGRDLLALVAPQDISRFQQHQFQRAGSDFHSRTDVADQRPVRFVAGLAKFAGRHSARAQIRRANHFRNESGATHARPARHRRRRTHSHFAQFRRTGAEKLRAHASARARISNRAA